MKRYRIAVTVELIVEADDDAEHARFHLEENHCIGNELQRLGEHVAAEFSRSRCSVCSHATVKLLGKTIDPLYPPPKGKES